MKAIAIGILASLFFASTFVLNRAMDLSGGNWIWSASLRYLFMVPFLAVIVASRHKTTQLFAEMKARPLEWLGWSTIGFGLFYAPLCFAAAYGPAWLIAATWQITIVAGSLLVPLFYDEVTTVSGSPKKRHKIPGKELATSAFILVGVGLVQLRGTGSLELSELIMVVAPVVVAAFAYPLGNRKMMSICKDRLDVYQRVLGMTLASMPFWLMLSFYGLATTGLPSTEQTFQSFLVAVCSGVIATVLFFYATDCVRNSPRQLAAVEATQAGEVVFTVAGEVLFLAGTIPSGWSLLGIVVIVFGMIAHSMSAKKA